MSAASGPHRRILWSKEAKLVVPLPHRAQVARPYERLPRELKKATLSLEMKGQNQAAQFQVQQAALEMEIAKGAEELRALFEAVNRAKEAKAAMPPQQAASARGGKGRRGRNQAPGV